MLGHRLPVGVPHSYNTFLFICLNDIIWIVEAYYIWINIIYTIELNIFKCPNQIAMYQN